MDEHNSPVTPGRANRQFGEWIGEHHGSLSAALTWDSIVGHAEAKLSYAACCTPFCGPRHSPVSARHCREVTTTTTR